MQYTYQSNGRNIMRTEWTPETVAPNERELERVKREERREKDRELAERRDRGYMLSVAGMEAMQI